MSTHQDPWRARRERRARTRAGMALGAAVTAGIGLVLGLNIAAANVWAAWCLTAVLAAVLAGIGFGVWEEWT